MTNYINVLVIPRIGDTIMSGAQHMHMFHLLVLDIRHYAVQPEYLFMKCALDIILSDIAFIITFSVFVVVAIAIKATDGGPVFYKQCRLTKDDKEFNVLSSVA